MICPYRRSIHIYEKNIEKEDIQEHIYREDYLYETCLKEECGAWHDGKCNFKKE